MKGKKEEIFQLALPAAVENILHALVGFVDTWMISKIGLIAVTAVGRANNLMMVYLAVFTALGTGTSSLIARSIGAGKKRKNKGILYTVYSAGDPVWSRFWNSNPSFRRKGP